MARPRVLDEVKKGEIAALISTGMSMSNAARYVGCDRKTIRREREVDEAFDERIRRAQMGAELKPLQAIREAASKHWRAAAWLIERQDKQRAARRKAKQADKVTVSRKQLAKVAVKVKQAALSMVAFPEFEAEVAQKIDEALVELAPVLAAPRPPAPEPVEVQAEVAEPVKAETEPQVAKEAAKPNGTTTPPAWLPPSNPTWQQSAAFLEQLLPERYGPPSERPTEPPTGKELKFAAALQDFRDDLFGVLRKEHAERTGGTCGEQPGGAEPAEVRKESGNTEVRDES
ncbi:hypothetical protein [Aeoliella sp.]|uniref:hypothetical protein n=1 Tax=Aeoliella sp. TaxID=2795800 RepID=UPI003CCC3523